MFFCLKIKFDKNTQCIELYFEFTAVETGLDKVAQSGNLCC